MTSICTKRFIDFLESVIDFLEMFIDFLEIIIDFLEIFIDILDPVLCKHQFQPLHLATSPPRYPSERCPKPSNSLVTHICTLLHGSFWVNFYVYTYLYIYTHTQYFTHLNLAAIWG